MGPKTKIKTGGKKFDEQKYEKKIRAPWEKLFTHQFQTAERILAPDWAEWFSTQSGASIRSAVWNWCVKSLSPGARIFLSYFCSSNFFPPILIFVFGPTICPWVSDDGLSAAILGHTFNNLPYKEDVTDPKKTHYSRQGNFCC